MNVDRKKVIKMAFFHKFGRVRGFAVVYKTGMARRTCRAGWELGVGWGAGSEGTSHKHAIA